MQFTTKCTHCVIYNTMSYCIHLWHAYPFERAIRYLPKVICKEPREAVREQIHACRHYISRSY